jgi:type II secretory pathway pseudopilin PulG
MIKHLKLKNNWGFTILELLVSMTLFALITTSVLIAVQNLGIARIKTLNRVALLEELYFFSEQLFTTIKDGGTLDYEEYWNRQAVWTLTQSGYYTTPTWVGNYWFNGNLGTTNYGTGIYLCRSNNWSVISGWCLTNFNNAGNGNAPSALVADFSGIGWYQRYGQYLAQFTDYNSNADIDFWDEDLDGNIIGDDDDRSIGDVPEILTGSMNELYLINKWDKTRVFFRWIIRQDPNTPISCIIDTTSVPWKTITGSGCIWNVQILKLKWLDIGYSHSWWTTDKTAYDGVIDTWACTEFGQCTGPLFLSTNRIATGNYGEWLDLFPSTVNVKNLKFQIFPVKDPWLSWAAPDCTIPSCISPFIHPYVRMNLEMWFSWGKRRAIRNDDPTISISTSISLSDFE